MHYATALIACIADLSNADLSNANLIKAIGITPEQIKKAENWQQACYDRAFRKKLGLPSQNPKLCADDEGTRGYLYEYK